jgi:putative spermidine/putrescine transport system permease protein
LTVDGFWASFTRSALLGGAWGVLIFLVGPLFVVIPASLTDQRYLSLPEHRLSLQHYRSLVDNDLWVAAALQSLSIASVATAASVVLGTLCAIACWRLSNRWSSLVVLMMLMPIIVPTVIQGLAMYRAWVSLGLFDTLLGVMVAHTLTGIPYVIITVSASLAGFDVRLEQAARGVGASVLATLRLVILPALVPGILSGALFSFVHSFDELVVVLFVTSRSVQTLPKRIWDGIQDDIDPAIAAVAVALMVMTVGALIIQMLIRSAQERVRRAGSEDTAGTPGAPMTVAG